MHERTPFAKASRPIRSISDAASPARTAILSIWVSPAFVKRALVAPRLVDIGAHQVGSRNILPTCIPFRTRNAIRCNPLPWLHHFDHVIEHIAIRRRHSGLNSSTLDYSTEILLVRSAEKSHD